MAKSRNVTEVNDTTFEDEVLAAEVPVLVDFGAAWCPPCRLLAPIVERIAEEHAGTVKVVIVDADASPRAARLCGVRGVPTLVVFRNGEKTAQHLGATTRERVLALLAQ